LQTINLAAVDSAVTIELEFCESALQKFPRFQADFPATTLRLGLVTAQKQVSADLRYREPGNCLIQRFTHGCIVTHIKLDLQAGIHPTANAFTGGALKDDCRFPVPH
jgi:hypothetical protein